MEKKTNLLNLHVNHDKIKNCEKEADEIINYIKKNNIIINNILDIGGGLSIRTAYIARELNAKLYILDGDKSDNNNKQTRDINVGSSENFEFYFTFENIREMVDKYNIEYEIINVIDIIIEENVIFDLICSFRSCGFHYPIKEYFNLINPHKSNNSLLLFDIRKNYEDTLEGIEIIENIEVGDKHTRSIIKLLNQ
jgi:hypothetical protein